ncbi:DUF362 domain-containing protein [Patescibacteria group bacterium]|nr:DUF362 domain-containing protein [Patescibacteria group bacterium]MBU0964365.1 DUF362 domain-containing protein [Patescibacteria group bacterium]
MDNIIITKIKATQNLTNDLTRLLTPFNGLQNFIKSGDKVLIKPNFNTADPPPASTSLDFLEAVVNLVKTAQPGKIIIGDSCTITQKTQTVMEALGVFELGKRLEVGITNFDKGKFIKKKISGQYLKTVSIPKIIYEADKIIILPCLKTHRFANFTMSLKMAVGLMKKLTRLKLHTGGHLGEKIAELNTAYKPDLILLDGRKAFITHGPAQGDLVKPNILMAGTDRIAMDIEALKILTSYQADNKLQSDIWYQPQIKRAVELGLGVQNPDQYKKIDV